MPAVIDYVIEGAVQDGNRVDFTKDKLSVHAFIRGQDMAQGTVDASGHYELKFKYDEQAPPTQLRVLPAELSERCAQTPALSDTFNPTRYVRKDNKVVAHRDLRISSEYLDLVKSIFAQYHMHGTVFVQGQTTLEELPGIKMDFYERSFLKMPCPLIPGIPGPLYKFVERTTFLGTCYSSPRSSNIDNYDFTFRFATLSRRFPFPQPVDKEPDILVRFSQFFNGVWQQIFESPVDWDIPLDFHRDFIIPESALLVQVMDPGLFPAVGLRFTGIGLLPVDAAHMIQGYAYSATGDPLGKMDHRPFAGSLRISGLFAQANPVTHYKVQIASTTATYTPGVTPLSWEDLTDQLVNLCWNPTTAKWEQKLLGPNPTTHIYTNIDGAPTGDWFEGALKIIWNTSNWPDGYYVLRIVPCDAAGNEITIKDLSNNVISPFAMPMICVANTLPQVDLVASDAAICGKVKLDAARHLNLLVTAYDPDGHVLSYTLGATRGAYTMPDEVAQILTVVPPSPTDPPDPVPGIGLIAHPTQTTVALLPPSLAACTTLAYGVELVAYGSGTNCYPNFVQWKRKLINLMISET